MSEPREWWIRPEASYCGEFIFDEDPKAGELWGPLVHVIEFSTYDAAVKEWDAAKHVASDTENSLEESRELVQALEKQVRALKDMRAERDAAVKTQDRYRAALNKIDSIEDWSGGSDLELLNKMAVIARQALGADKVE